MISKLKGNGIGWLLEQENGLAAFGLFVLLLEAAGDVPPPRDGSLVNSDGRPYEVDDLRRLTGVKEPQLKEGLELLTSDKLAWLTCDSHVADMCQSDGGHVSPKIRSDKIRSDHICSPKKDTFSDNTHFEMIWETLPSAMKTHKKKAARHYKASVKTKEDYELLIDALGKYLQTKRVRDGFYQNGDTFLNNWRDWLEYEDPKPQKTAEQVMDDRPCSICGKRLGDMSYSGGKHIECEVRRVEQEG